MKLWNWFIKCPLLFLLLAAWLGLTAFTWSEGRIPDALGNDVIENPVFTALLEPEESLLGNLDGSLDLDISELDTENPDTDDLDTENTGNADTQDDDVADADSTSDSAGRKDGMDGKDTENEAVTQTGSTSVKEQKADGQDNQAAEEKGEDIKAGVTKFKSYDKIETDSQYYSDPGKKALTTEYPYEKVDKSYFDDAVFIGDSRTVGMQDYSGLDNAQFFAKTGMNVYEVLEDKFIKDPESGKDVSVAHMLKTNTYGKIYFMVGINELGTGNTGTFQKAYERVLSKFRKWQPDAVIYIQGIIPVSEEKASEDAIFNNININDKNVAIAQLADGLDTFYLDVSGKLTDKEGYLRADYTFDNVHMYAQYYELWTNYLMKHAVVRK